MNLRAALLVTLLLSLIPGCAATRGAYYDAWESLGYAKRERLVDNVKEAREEQVEAKQQFQDALEQFRSVVNFDGGDLEKLYNKLRDEYEQTADAADDVKSQVASVKNVGQALFTEWRNEIRQIKDDESLQRQSQALYDRTYESYEEMIRRMDAAVKSMEPVLQRFNNHVLVLKHQLNAQAIASLEGEEIRLGQEVDRLIRQMEAAIAEADTFLATAQPSAGG